MQLRQYETGQVIFRENEWGETAYVVEHGRVEVLKMMNGTTVHLAFIEAGESFGEMGLIDEKPRSATIVAVARTTVREFHRDDLMSNLQLNPEMSIPLLKLLFERLREANATILEMHQSGQGLLPPVAARQPVFAHQTGVFLEGITSEARQALVVPVLEIPRLPFRIGRKSTDALAHNDFSIVDHAPFHISRNHVTIAKSGNRVSISDRGSRQGFLLDGQRIGGDGSPSSTIFLARPEAILVLGAQSSPFQFRLRVSQ